MTGKQKAWSAHFEVPEAEDAAFGIKRLSYENFLTPAFAALLFGDGLSTRPYLPTPDFIRASIERFTSVALPEHVPETVWQMFEVAKGAMVYGLFFYPLYMLGEEHLSKLFEWIVKDQYAKRSGRATRKLKVAFDWLTQQHVFPEGEDLRWLAAYKIRNEASHPKMQSIATPASASRALHLMRYLIVHLYAEESEVAP